MHAVEKWLHDGKMRFLREGRKEGQVDTILLFTRAKFGSVPKELEVSLVSATSEELDDLTIQIINATSIEEAMNRGGGASRMKGNGAGSYTPAQALTGCQCTSRPCGVRTVVSSLLASMFPPRVWCR